MSTRHRFMIAVVFLIGFLSISCSNETRKQPIDYDFAELHDSSNDGSQLPDDIYFDEEQNDEMTDTGSDNDVAGVDENNDEKIDEDVIPDLFADEDEIFDESADIDEMSNDEVRDFKVEITVPSTSVVYEADTDIAFQAKVTDTKYSPDQITVKWVFDDGTTPVVLDEKKADASGVSVFTYSFPEGEATYYTVTAVAVDPDSVEVSSKDLILGICTYRYGKVQTFDTAVLGEGWVITKDSYHDSDPTNGWLELTGNVTNRQGAIYNDQLELSPGDITMKIDIRTGKPDLSDGADGFAMTVYGADNTVPLTDYVDATRTGGCLGYGVAGDYCGSGGALDVNAFHIEFDTWHNVEVGLEDPTTNNHIAINLNGDPGGHLLYEEVALEDFVWHTVEITTSGSKVTVKMDGSTIIDDTIPDFSFRGGYIVFSGSTGASTNFHSVDNLEIVHECTVPSN